MSDKYAGKANDRRYEGEDIDITYNLKRCIHAEECVHRLSSVWDVQKRPWINPDGASGEEIAAVIYMCPSGALHYDRKDGGTIESVPDENQIILWEDGPLQVRGDLSLQGAQVDIEEETRATLCRCGASENKPFCDNTHKKISFTTGVPDAVKIDDDIETGGKLTITATQNGPLKVEGNFRIETQAGDVVFTGSKTWLCRCGGSSKKPFCDGTHNKNGFSAE